MSEFIERVDNSVYETESPVKYAVADGIATVTMNRTEFNNAQNSQMTYALDAAFKRAISDDAVKVIVLRGEGKHFSAGADLSGAIGLLQAGDFLAEPADGLSDGDIAGCQLSPYLRQDAVALCDIHSGKPPSGESLRKAA